MRQRRARTPSSTQPQSPAAPNPNESPPESNAGHTPSAAVNVLPDLLPRTFHLAESSSLFSQINEGKEPNHTSQLSQKAGEPAEPTFSVVAIRESNLTEPKKPTFTGSGDKASAAAGSLALLTPKIGEINTVSILEKVDFFEPEYVETVNIIDATSETSDTDTCTTPVLDETRSRISREDIENMQIDEALQIPELVAAVTAATTPATAIRSIDSPIILKVERKKMKLTPLGDGGKCVAAQSNDRDILRDSESTDHRRKPVKLKKKQQLAPRLKDDLSPTGRDSFYNSDHENFEEPLVFSDDDDLQTSMPVVITDFDSDDDCDMVFMFILNFFFSFFFVSRNKNIYFFFHFKKF